MGKVLISAGSGKAMSDAADMAFAYRNWPGTETCELSVPAGTFKAFCVGIYDWIYGSPGGSWNMKWNGTVIESGTQIVGPGTLMGSATLNSGNTTRAYTFCAISYG